MTDCYIFEGDLTLIQTEFKFVRYFHSDVSCNGRVIIRIDENEYSKIPTSIIENLKYQFFVRYHGSAPYLNPGFVIYDIDEEYILFSAIKNDIKFKKLVPV